MRYPTTLALCLFGTIAHSEIVPAIPTEAELLVSGTCFGSELPKSYVYCEVYQEVVGGTVVFWEQVRLKSTSRVIRISSWDRFSWYGVLFEAEGFFTNK